MNSVRRGCLFVVLIILSLSSSLKAENAIVGKWRATGSDAGAIMQFFDEGTVTIKSSRGAASGNYKVLDKEHVRLDVAGLGDKAGPDVYEFQIVGDKLTLKSLKGNIMECERTNLTDTELAKSMGAPANRSAPSGTQADNIADSNLRNAATAEEARYATTKAYVTCVDAEDCNRNLPGFLASPGVTISMTAQGKTFRGTARHAKGTGKVFLYDSGRGGMQ